MALNEVIQSSGAWLNSVHRTCVETAAVSRGTSHAPNSAISTPLGRILLIRTIKGYSHSFRIFLPSTIGLMVSVDVKHHVYLLTIQNHMRPERSESAREQRIALYKSDQ